MRRRSRDFYQRTLRPWWYAYEWPVIGAIALAVVVLGCVGFHRQLQAGGKPTYFADLVFKSFQLFVLQISVDPPMPWPLETARLLAPLVAAYTAFKALATLFADQIRSFRLRLCRQHVIICGLGRKGYLLAQRFLHEGRRVVIVEQDEDNDFLPQCRAEGALVVIGDAAEEQVLIRASTGRARCVLVVCGDDGVNAQVAAQLRQLPVPGGGQRLTCIIHIADPDLYWRIRTHELASHAHGGLRLEFFNIFRTGARALFNEFPLFNQAVGPGQPPHLLVVGDGLMAEALTIEAVRSWGPRFASLGERLAVTVVASEAVRRTGAWRIKHAHLNSAGDLRALDRELDSAVFQEAAFTQGATLVVVCLEEDDARGISTALALRRCLKDHPVPVIACLVEEEGLPTLLRPVESASLAGGGLYFFGLLNRTCSPDLLPGGIHEKLARRLHEEYVRQQREKGGTPEQNPMLAPWDKLPPEYQESNRLETDFIWVKLRAIQCTVEPLIDPTAARFEFTPMELETISRLEHERWRSERMQAGWSHGPQRNEAQKLNPKLVPWAEAPESLKEENRQMARQLPAQLAEVEFQVRRLTW